MCSGVVGLFGEPFDIETSSEFSSAVLTFKMDKSMLGDTEFDNLMFLWYDEENEKFVELTTVSIPGKCGNPDTIKYYHKMHSNPI